MKKLLIATHNPGKIKELQTYLGDLPVELVSLSDVGITHDVKEDGTTYEENSQKKALYYAKESGLPAVSDDGGIEIAALNNEPGVKSKRWLGYEATDEELIAHMAKVAKELPDDNRNARFRAVLSLALPTGEVWSVEDEIKGVIAQKPLGAKLAGLPYRLYFYLSEINKYYHEQDLPPEEMKKYNHRFKAVQRLKPLIVQHVLNKN